MSRNRNNTAEVIENVNEESTVTQEQVTQEVTAEVAQEEVVEPVKEYDVPALFETHKTKSNVIRFLSSEGLKTGEIHKVLVKGGVKSANGTDIRYQHVRNVLTQPLKKAS